MTYQEMCEKSKHWDKVPMKDRHYYRYIGFDDGSGCPSGYVISCLPEEQVEFYREGSRRYIRID